jgi:hypothetical protein
MFDEINEKKYQGFLVILILAVLVGIWCQIASFYRVHTMDPLENIQVDITKPVYAESKEIVWYGTYDRKIYCRLVDFHMILKHDSGAVIYMLKEDQLTRSPSISTKPGKNIPIVFALRTPVGMALGDYTSEFWGLYFCGKGIFRSQRAVNLEAGKFTVEKQPN